MNPNESIFIKKLNALKEVQLSDAQKGNMRSVLSSYADLHDVPAEVISHTRVYTSFFFSRAFVGAALILVLVVTSGVGVTYAAGNALPGQPLYAIKVDVAEPIQGALITSPTGQAEWQNELAERRLSEATTLAAANDLATSTQVYLEQQATDHIDQSEADTAQLAANGNTDSALSVRSDLEARLSAHARILALLDAHFDATGDASTTLAVASLLQDVSQAQTVVSMSREAVEMTLAGVTATSTATSTATTTTTTASSTPAQTARIAFINSQTSDRQKEEMQLFIKDAVKLGLLPATTTATSTAAHHRHDDGSATSTASTTSLETPPTTPTSVPPVEESSSTDASL